MTELFHGIERTPHALSQAFRSFSLLSEEEKRNTSKVWIGNELFIHLAAEYLKPGELRAILAYTHIDVLSKTGNTPLHYAVAARNAGGVRYLVQNGADTNLSMPAFTAIRNASVECFTHLLQGNPSLGESVHFLGGTFTLHDLISNSSIEIIREATKHLVETGRMAESIAAKYLSRLVLAHDYNGVVDLLQVGIYGKKRDVHSIAMAIFATCRALTTNNIVCHYSRWIPELGLVEPLKMILSQFPHTTKLFLNRIRSMMRSGRSYEMMMVLLAVDPNILETDGILAYHHYRTPWVYEIEETKRGTYLDITSMTNDAYNGVIEDLERLKWVIYASGVCATNYGLPHENRMMKTSYRQPLGVPPLFDMVKLRIDIEMKRMEVNDMKERVASAKKEGRWQLIFD